MDHIFIPLLQEGALRMASEDSKIAVRLDERSQRLRSRRRKHLEAASEADEASSHSAELGLSC